MLTIINNETNPFYNLALEEYVLKYLNINDDFILLWQNEPSIIIGRNQNTIEEINSQYVKEHKVNVVRRNSGGGAVYHDFGNLNYSFITKSENDSINNFKKFTQPVIDLLNELGVGAIFSGRNDITVDEKKISGNAQCYYQNKMLHHGTILFNSNLDTISEILQVKQEKIESKGIKSVRSRVTNIFPHLEEKITIDEFKEKLLFFILGSTDSSNNIYYLTDIDKKEINKLMNQKYLTWEWNYGESPHFDIQKSHRFAGGKIDIRLNIKNGVIENCRIFGDFFGNKDITQLEKSLVSNRFEETTIKNILIKQNLNEFLFNISIDDFIQCLFY